MNAWHWHPSVVLGLEGLLGLYLLGVGPLRRRYGWGPPPGSARIALFLGGVATLGVALLGPLAEWAEHVALSAHMAQHLLLLLVAPVLCLLGTPGWLLRPLLRLPGVAPVGRALTRPPAALGLASAVQVAWHFPAAFGAALEADTVHALEHLTLLGTALLLWWPIAGPLPEWPRPGPPAQLLYLFLGTIPMMAIAAPITLAEGVVYRAYEHPAAPWPLDPRADQELAGILMWVGGMVGYLVAGTIVFFRWAGPAAREEQALGEEAAHGHA